jgi:hypothetical protein
MIAMASPPLRTLAQVRRICIARLTAVHAGLVTRIGGYRTWRLFVLQYLCRSTHRWRMLTTAQRNWLGFHGPGCDLADGLPPPLANPAHGRLSAIRLILTVYGPLPLDAIAGHLLTTPGAIRRVLATNRIADAKICRVIDGDTGETAWLRADWPWGLDQDPLALIENAEDPPAGM